MSIINPYRYAAVGFACDAAVFDGSNDYLERADWTSNANSDLGIMSYWVSWNGSDGATLALASITDGELTYNKGGGNVMMLKMLPPFDEMIFDIAMVASSTWYHIIFSWDASASYHELYINGVKDSTEPTGTGDFNWTQAKHTICAQASGAGKVDGDVAEVYINNEAFLDLSDAANLQKFRDTDGKPVDLGADGSTPTGSSPRVYLHLDDGETVANFAVNAGTGGDYTINGTLVTAATSPSD